MRYTRELVLNGTRIVLRRDPHEVEVELHGVTAIVTRREGKPVVIVRGAAEVVHEQGAE